jgi:signal transduction histidine kinase/ligand-binding sensor domain-containing protein/CheY-like chemotaxis protein
VRSLLDGGKGALWLGTDAGVYRLDKNSGQVALVGSPVRVAQILLDSRGRLLVGTLKGVKILDPATGSLEPFLKDTDPTGGWFKATRPQAILEDRSQTYWVGTFAAGLYHLDPTPKKFRLYRHMPGDPTSLIDNFVIGICEDSRGNVWVGTGADLNVQDAASGRFSRLFNTPLGIVRAVFEDKNGTIWAGVPLGIVRKAPGKAPEYLRFDENENPAKCPGRSSKSIFQDSRGVIWFGGGDGLFRQELGSSVFTKVDYQQLPTDTNIIYHINEDQLSRLWVSTNNGLVRFDADRRQVQYFRHDPENPSSLSDDISCVVARNGQIWVASYDGGFEKYDEKTGTFRHYRRKNGLPDEKIWGMVEDDRGLLWMSHCKGLSCFDPATETFRHFDVEDGLQDYEFVVGSFHKSKKTGRLYFGGSKGFNVFHPDSLVFNQTQPPVVFTAFRYHRGALEETDIMEIPGISIKNQVVLPYPAQMVVCEFAALDYRQTNRNRFAYRLDAIHENWIDLGTKREVTFANLRPGTYTLHVKASNNDGVWNEDGAKLSIVIRPPWWATWWAYLLYALALGGTVWLVYKNQLRQRLQEQETLRLRELDDFKNRFFTNITHEFRTPLTVILGTSEQVEKSVEEGLKGKMKLIRRNAESLLRLINQILDLAKLESNTLKINYVQGDVLPYLRYIAESLHSFANAQNVMLRVESKEREITMDYDPERLLQIVYNLLSNAIKFTPSGGRVVLSVNHGDFKNHYDFVRLTVSDNGVGIPADDLPHIFDRFYQANNSPIGDRVAAKAGGTGIGLALTKELVQLMGGKIVVKSELSKGTTFTVLLPITNVGATLAVAQPEVAPAEQAVAQPQTGRPQGSSLPPANDDSPSILLIEDNPDVLEYIAACLGGFGNPPYTLDFAYNGRAGIEKALETIPDLIISDVMMPEKDGFEVCETLKNDERTSHIPIVLLTAKAGVENRIAGLKRGADAYLSKPFHQEELLVTITNLLEVRKKLQQKYLQTAFQPAILSSPQVSPSLNPDVEDLFVRKVKDAILVHISNPDFTVEDLSRSLAMSQRQLHRKLSALTNQGPIAMLRSIRLAKGKELLLAGDKNVSEVAFEVGFDDPKYFSRVFTEEFGVPPSKI